MADAPPANAGLDAGAADAGPGVPNRPPAGTGADDGTAANRLAPVATGAAAPKPGAAAELCPNENAALLPPKLPKGADDAAAWLAAPAGAPNRLLGCAAAADPPAAASAPGKTMGFISGFFADESVGPPKVNCGTDAGCAAPAAALPKRLDAVATGAPAPMELEAGAVPNGKRGTPPEAGGACVALAPKSMAAPVAPPVAAAGAVLPNSGPDVAAGAAPAPCEPAPKSPAVLAPPAVVGPAAAGAPGAAPNNGAVLPKLWTGVVEAAGWASPTSGVVVATPEGLSDEGSREKSALEDAVAAPKSGAAADAAGAALTPKSRVDGAEAAATEAAGTEEAAALEGPENPNSAPLVTADAEATGAPVVAGRENGAPALPAVGAAEPVDAPKSGGACDVGTEASGGLEGCKSGDEVTAPIVIGTSASMKCALLPCRPQGVTSQVVLQECCVCRSRECG